MLRQCVPASSVQSSCWPLSAQPCSRSIRWTSRTVVACSANGEADGAGGSTGVGGFGAEDAAGAGFAVKVCMIGVVVGGTEMASPSDAPEGACAAWHAGMRQISSHSRSILRAWRPKDTRATKAPNGATGRIAIAPNESTSHKRGHQVLLTVLGGNLRLCIHRDCSAHATTE